jgi:chromosome segregation ATPase
MDDESSERPYSRLVIARGIMTLTREDRATKTYTINNSDITPRDIVIEHLARSNWKLAEGIKPEETSASFQRFRVKVEPKKSAQLVVQEYQPMTTELELTNLTSDFIALLTEQKRMTSEMEQAFKRVLDQKTVIAGLDAQIKSRHQEESSITNDQGRIRENMKALKGSAEEKALLQRYTHQLDQQEDRLGVLRSQIADLTTKRQQASDQLDKILAEISLDESF